MVGGGDFATGFFSAAGNKMDQTLQQHREDDLARKKELTDMYNAVLQNPYSTDQQRSQAWAELQKLYPSKESKGILQKFQTLFHLGHAFNKAQQQQGGGEMSEQTPIGGSSTNPPAAATQPNANIMAPQVPAKAGPTPPPAAAALGPGYAAAPARPGGGPTPPPGSSAATAQSPPGASPKGAGGKTQNKGTEAATSPTDLSSAVSPNINQLLDTYRKHADIEADIAAKKSTARRAPTTLGEWIEAYKKEHNGDGPSAQGIMDFTNKTKGAGQAPIKLAEADYFRLMSEGKTDEAQAVLDKINKVKTAEKGKAATGTSLLATIRQSIDPNASSEDRALAKKSIAEYTRQQEQVQMARGKGYAMYRAMYQLNTYLDQNTGEQVVMSNFDASNRIRNGESLTQVGHLSAQQVAAAQKFVQESVPAISEARKYLKAYDDPEARLIFARVMDELGPPPSGEEVSWVGNVLDQALLRLPKPSPEKVKENVDKFVKENGRQPTAQELQDLTESPTRRLIPRLVRLKETVGSLRQSLGAPATDSSMALMLALIPGPTAPDAAYAGDLLDQFEQNARNSVSVPILKPAVGAQLKKGPGPTPPPPSSGGRPPLSQFEH